MSAIARYLLLALGLYAWGATPSRAEDLERGKSGPAIFAADCAACHRSAQGLAYGMSSRDLMDLLRQRGSTVAYFDPHVPEIPPTREHPQLCGLRSIKLDEESLSAFDAVLIATDHSAVDYDALVQFSRLVVDTRNATKRLTGNRDKVTLL